MIFLTFSLSIVVVAILMLTTGGGTNAIGKESHASTITFEVDEAVSRLYLRIRSSNNNDDDVNPSSSSGNFNPRVALLNDVFPSIWEDFYPGRSPALPVKHPLLDHHLIHFLMIFNHSFFPPVPPLLGPLLPPPHLFKYLLSTLR